MSPLWSETQVNKPLLLITTNSKVRKVRKVRKHQTIANIGNIH